MLSRQTSLPPYSWRRLQQQQMRLQAIPDVAVDLLAV
jgi:hypothetical protein